MFFNPSKEDPERIKKLTKKKKTAEKLDYDGISFPCKKKILTRLR